MGQYHILVNLDKKQFIFPHGLGTGLKLWEQAGIYIESERMGGTSIGQDRMPAAKAEVSVHGSIYTYAAWMLLAASNGRGGGDYTDEESKDAEHLIGSWAGDRIALLGDYAEPDDLRRSNNAESRAQDVGSIYDYCSNAYSLRTHPQANVGEDMQTDGWLDITPAVVLLIEASNMLKYSSHHGGWGQWEVDYAAAAAAAAEAATR